MVLGATYNISLAYHLVIAVPLVLRTERTGISLFGLFFFDFLSNSNNLFIKRRGNFVICVSFCLLGLAFLQV